ncbi:MAG: DUF5117 domain-containing protein [Methanothrix sp.]|nr:MAG: DUF5117 domain-containing protein [Methanothrix sp.]
MKYCRSEWHISTWHVMLVLLLSLIASATVIASAAENMTETNESSMNDVKIGNAANEFGNYTNESAVRVIAVRVFAANESAVNESAEDEENATGLQENKTVVAKGAMNLYGVGSKLYLEIPASVFGKDMLWYAEPGKFPIDVSGELQIGSRVVRWELKGNNVLLRDLTRPLQKKNLTSTRTEKQKNHQAGSTKDPLQEQEFDPIDLAVQDASLAPVMMSFPIVALGQNGSMFIDISDTFASDIREFSAEDVLSDSGYEDLTFVPEDSFIDDFNAFPQNIVISSLLTFHGEKDGDKGSVSIIVNHSITLLPENSMMPRYSDPRVGYFKSDFQDYSNNGNGGVADKNIILRFRLEKKDPNAALSEPIEPIVFYLSREIPNQWRPYLKEGIEDWNAAFEEAGFKNAIVAKDAPSPEEDPDWSPSDTRHSVIRWQALSVANAMGPCIFDPRSGEVLSAHVILWADIVSLAQKWYFIQASASDPRARKLPLPENITGTMLRYILSHEIGHTLGLRHNHKASQAFTIDQLRDPAFTSEYSDTASIMSYGRLNYVAQPEDNVTRLIPMIGPYDEFAIRWGYKPVPGATSAMAERTTLDSWAAEGVENPWLLFGGEDNPSYTDPTVHTENIGSDRINATALGIKNLARVMGYLVPATVSKGQDFSELGTMYDAVLSQRLKWLGSVVKLVGGVEETRTLAGRGDVQFRRVPKERQEQAVEFLMQNLRTPKEFMPTAVIDNITSSGATKKILASQELILYGLLNPHKYQLLAEANILEPASAYNLSSLLGDVQDGLWEELSQDKQDRINIDPVRRDLQRYHLSLLQDQLDGKDDSAFALAYLLTIGLDLKVDQSPGDTLDISSDFRPAAMSSLKELRGTIETAMQKGADEDTRIHLVDCLERIDEILAENVPGNTSSLSES